MHELIVEADGGSRGNPGPTGPAAVTDAATSKTPPERPEDRGLTAALHPTTAPAKGHEQPRPQPQRRPDDPTSVSPAGAESPHVPIRLQVGPGEGRGELRTQPRRTVGRTATAGPRNTGAEDVRAARNVAQPPDLGTPTTFVLLRHGETALTPQKRFSGSGAGEDPPLSDTGRHQAEQVATALAARGTVQAIVSSPLTRCRETAELAAARLGLDVQIEDGLRETDFGAWEGLTFAEVRQRHPDDMNAWLGSPDVEPTGGGESFEAVAVRVAAARDRLLAAYAGRTVLLVSHVTPIKTLVRLALGAPPEALFRMELSAASLSAVAYYADGNASVRLLNDTSALR